MTARTATASIKYSGREISVRMGDKATGFSYTDQSSGSADSISMTIADREEKWISSWFPKKGDKLYANISTENWELPGGGWINCGEFILDDVSASGPPTSLSIGAVSAPAEDGFSQTKTSQTWEGVTVRQIAASVALRNGLKLEYDCPTEITIAAVEQNKSADSDFITKLCDEYGLCVKIYSSKIVIFDLAEYEKKEAVGVIHKGDTANWSFSTTLEGTYTGGEYTYTHPVTGEDITVTVGDDKRKLTVNGNADNSAEAEAKLRGQLTKANHGMTTMSITTLGRTDLVAGQNIQISGFGEPDGKYFIDKVTHSISKGYTCKYDLSKVG